MVKDLNSGVEIRCSTQIDGIRKCNKYLGTFVVYVGTAYCKSCKQHNYYEIVTAEGLTRLKLM